MTRFSDLLYNSDYRIRMIAVRHAWALEWRRVGDASRAADNFAEARERLHQIRDGRH